MLVEEVAEQLPDTAVALHVVDLAVLDHAGRDQRRLALGRADADEHQVGGKRQVEHIADTALAEQDLAVFDRVGEEGHRHHIGLRAGSLRQPIDDVMRVGGEFPCEAAEERDEAHVARGRARQVLDARRQRAAVADADQLVLAALDLELEESGAGDAERPERQVVLIEIRDDLAVVEAVGARQRLLELHAFADVAVDEDLNQAFLVGLHDQSMGLETGEAETLGHLRLRQAAGVMQPGGTGRKTGIVVAQRNGAGFHACSSRNDISIIH